MLLFCSVRGMKMKEVFWAMICIVNFVDTIQAQTTTIGPSNSMTETFKSVHTTAGGKTVGASTEIPTTEARSEIQTMTEATSAANNATSVVTQPGPTSTSPAENLGTNATLSTNSSMPDNYTVTETASTHKSNTETSIPSEDIHTSTMAMTHTTHSTVTLKNITEKVECVNVRDVEETEVICLQHSETITCENVKEKMGKMLCGSLNNLSPTNAQCDIKFSDSETNPLCLLLIYVRSSGQKVEFSEDTKNMLAKDDITLRKELLSNHRYKPRTTLIALITTGLVVAALILCGYFLSNRQSWSPGSQRLGEDPYYAENDSPDNTLISVAARDQSGQPDKSNLKGGTQENGMGQTVTAAATNGHSNKQHVVADTEL